MTTLFNLCILVSGKGSNKFSVFITDILPNLNIIVGGSQCFPLKLYEQNTGTDLYNQGAGDYTPKDGITDYAQKHFTYGDIAPDKQDIFYYVYGILHHPDYTKKWGDNLTKDLPHIPKVKTYTSFMAFSNAGRALADLHINYESADKHPVHFKKGDPDMLSDKDFKVTEMKFGKQGNIKDKTTIIYNDHITITNIPIEAYDYKVNGKSPVEWVMDRQSIKTHKNGIINNANDYATETLNNPRYPLDLLQQAITVSLETQKIINSLPDLDYVS